MKVIPACAAVAVAMALGQASQQPVFRSGASLVRFDVTVTDSRGPVRGLTARDFTVRDSGTVQTVTVQEVADAPLDVVAVVQPFTSISRTSKEQGRPLSAAVSALLGLLEDRDRAGVLMANAPPARVRPLAAGRPEVSLEQLSGEPDAALYDTISAALGEFPTTDRRQVLVVFSNGADFRSTVSPEALAAQARRLGPAFILVGAPFRIETRMGFKAETPAGMPIGDGIIATVAGGVFPATLRSLAHRTGGVLIDLGNGQPGALMKAAIEWMRTRYVVSYEPPSLKGWHPVSVQVSRKNATVTTREGYVID